MHYYRLYDYTTKEYAVVGTGIDSVTFDTILQKYKSDYPDSYDLDGFYDALRKNEVKFEVIDIDDIYF